MLPLKCLSLAFFTLICLPLPAQRAVPQEPANLGQLKTRLTDYHDCARPTCYTPQLNRQSQLAVAFLDRRVAHKRAHEKLAIILDIDETSLSNWEAERQDDFGYIQNDWNAWVDRAAATPIAGTLRVYTEAQRLGVAVFFITGRAESQRDKTAENLKTAGYTSWAGLTLRGPHPAGQLTAVYKSGARRQIVAAGYKMILNIGDQFSDLNGAPLAEYSVKLPNPFYYIP